MHKISKAAEMTDLDLYLTDPSDSTQPAEKLPHPTMSVFTKPQLQRYPRLAEGRIARDKANPKTSAAGRKAQAPLPDDVEKLKRNMQQEKKAKMEHSYVWMGLSGGVGASVLICPRVVPRSSMPRSVVPSAPCRKLARAATS